MTSWWLSKYIEIKLQAACLYLKYRLKKKQKEVLNYSLCLIFDMIFEKNLSSYILLAD